MTLSLSPEALLLRPETLAAGLALSPYLGGIRKRVDDRYDRYEKALIEAPFKVPGEKIVTASVKEFLEKRAGLQNGLKKEAAGGKNIKSLLSSLIGPKGVAVSGSLIGLGILGEPTISEIGERVKETIMPSTAELSERAKMDEEFAAGWASNTGKELGKRTVGLLGDILAKGISAPAQLLGSRQRASVFKTLQNEDDVISQADPKTLTEAYHTMVRFAPTLATDKNAVKTFLRESVLYGTGPNFVSIKQLADAEKAVQPQTISSGKK